MRNYNIIIPFVNSKLKHVLEFGVYKGKSIRIIRKNLSDRFKVFGFDSFVGLPEDWDGGWTRVTTQDEDGTRHYSEKFPVKKGHFNLNGNMPSVPQVKLYKGWFVDTIPQYLADYPDKKIGLLHIDCDLYSSTVTVLEELKNSIVKDTVIVFDEWRVDDQVLGGEEEACFEWVIKYGRSYEIISQLTKRQFAIKVII